MADDSHRESARAAIEDVIYRALEAGMTSDEVEAEVKYVLENADE